MPLLLARWRQAQTPYMELLSAAVAVAACEQCWAAWDGHACGWAIQQWMGCCCWFSCCSATERSCVLPIALPHAAAHPVGAWPNHPPFTGRLPAPADPVDCALLFQVKALLVFEPSEPLQLLARAFASGSSSLYWDVSRLPSRTGRAYIVTGAGACDRAGVHCGLTADQMRGWWCVMTGFNWLKLAAERPLIDRCCCSCCQQSFMPYPALPPPPPSRHRPAVGGPGRRAAAGH